MPYITVIRHAPTESNRREIFMGSMDIPSTEDGLRAAEELGQMLSGDRFEYRFCSPLARAKATAQLIFPDQPVILDAGLAERDLGSWSGQSKKDLRIQFPDAFNKAGRLDPYFTPPSGETFSLFVDRIRTFLFTVMNLEEDVNVAVVSHNGVIRVMRCMLEQRPLAQVFCETEPYLQPWRFRLTADSVDSMVNANGGV